MQASLLAKVATSAPDAKQKVRDEDQKLASECEVKSDCLYTVDVQR
jgi:hypothetical protein